MQEEPVKSLWNQITFYFDSTVTQKREEVINFINTNFLPEKTHYFIDNVNLWIAKMHIFFMDEDDLKLFRLIFDQEQINQAENKELGAIGGSVLYGHQVVNVNLAAAASNIIYPNPITLSGSIPFFSQLTAGY